MKTLVKPSRSGASRLHVARTPEDIHAIHDRGIGAVIWDRCPVPEFQDWIDGLSPRKLPVARMIVARDRVFDAVEAACDKVGTPNDPERSQLVGDVAALADLFASLMEADYLNLRLEAVQTDACRKFHIDYVSARLICTYRGPGTQYAIDDPDKDPNAISNVATGSPILLRGRHWPGHTGSGIVHRSPPIEGSATTRLVLVLDPASGPELDSCACGVPH